MKLESSKTRRPSSPRLEPPALERLGTLQELTRIIIGKGNDGGSPNHSHT